MEWNLTAEPPIINNLPSARDKVQKLEIKDYDVLLAGNVGRKSKDLNDHSRCLLAHIIVKRILLASAKHFR